MTTFCQSPDIMSNPVTLITAKISFFSLLLPARLQGLVDDGTLAFRVGQLLAVAI